jgi:hypothetical protein
MANLGHQLTSKEPAANLEPDTLKLSMAGSFFMNINPFYALKMKQFETL